MAVRIGFIGTGGIAQQHMRNLQKIEQAQVVGMFDVSRDRAETASRMFDGCKVYDSYQALLEKAQLEAAWICLPPFAHERHEIDAAGAGISLFVEKPIATTGARAIQINEAIESAGVIAAVGYNWRWLDTTARAKDVLRSSKIAMAQGYWWGGMPGVPWWRRKNQSGGQAVEQTTHIFDLARYLLGEVRRVYALGFQGLMQDIENYGTEDASSACLEFDGGTIANISSTDLLPSGAGKVGLDMIGRDIRLEIDFSGLTVYRKGEKTSYAPQVDPYFVEAKGFLEAVASKDGSKLLCTYADALRTHMVTMAVNRSMQSGKVEDVQPA